MPRSLKKETLPAPQGEVSLPAHLCCCERRSGVPRLPEPGRAGESPLSQALGSGTESCKKQLPEHDTSTNHRLARHSKPCQLARLECRHEPAV